MGIYIGNKTVGEVTVDFIGGVQSTTAYLGLLDRYNIMKKGDGNYYCRIDIGGWISKAVKVAGENSLPLKLLNFVEVQITEVEFNTALGENSIASFLLSKLIPKLEELVPTWNEKLVLDF